MAVGFSNTNKPLNPRGQDASPKGYNRASLFSGKALDFDGVNDNVDLDGFTLSGTTATICFNGLVTGSNRYFFWVGGKNYGIINHDTLGFGIFDSATWNYFGTTQRSEMNSYCVVNEGTTQRVYCNGVQIGSDATATAIDWSSPSKVLLGSNNAENEFLNGQLSGFKIFNTALTAAQVADLYNNPEKVVPTGLESNLKLWLPMMEGAGTTAYDGSGNGNHGTISGATYVNGIGAPSPQSAVMDWNKGQNYVKQSENFDNSDWAKYTSFGGTLNRTSNYAEAPDGSQTATRIEAAFDPNQSPSYGLLSTDASTSTSGNYIGSLWLKSNTGSSQNISMYVRAGINGSDILVTNEWQRVTKQGSGVNNYLTFGTRNDIGSADANIDILVWGASINYGTEVDSYVPTYGSGQESDVLLPQGLTTGRDITGVNLFENVRKQGALNLDGNSWAEVHDNASVDLSDANASFEAWVYHIDRGSVSQYIFNKYTGSGAGFRIRTETSNNLGFYITDGTNDVADNGTKPLTANAWNHIVITSDGTNFKRYIDGALVDTDVAGTALTTFANAGDLTIGVSQSLTFAAQSRIAQPRIYNRALTAEEVLRNYNAGKNTYTND